MLILAVAWLCPLVAGAADQPGKRYALLIGVDGYYNGLSKLKYCGADMTALRDELLKAGFEQDRIVLMTDDAPLPQHRPSKINMETQLQLLLGLSKPNDLVLLAFSGHGVFLDNNCYWCPPEARLEAPENTLVSVDEVYGQLKVCNASLRVVLVDACRDDPRVGRGKTATPAPLSDDFLRGLRRTPDSILLLNSCSLQQKSLYDDNLKHGIFSYFIVQGLQGAADLNQDGIVTLGELWDYAADKTQLHVRAKHNALQVPEHAGVFTRDAQRFPLGTARSSDVRPVASALPAPADANQKPGDLIANSIGMKLAWIPGGEMMMGSDEDPATLLKEGDYEPLSQLILRRSIAAEHPRHRVRIAQSFWMGTYEVTLAQFRQFVEAANYRTDAEKDSRGAWGWNGKDDFELKPAYNWRSWGVNQTESSPVVNISWNDAAAFCEWLTEKEGKKYRLPTEAEWEFACRAGTNTRYSCGNDLKMLVQVGNVEDATARKRFPSWNNAVDAADGFEFTAPAGRFRPNAFGLYDMHGNASEWCSDWYGEDFYTRSPLDDPQGPAVSDRFAGRVARGGSWQSYPVMCRSACRDQHPANFRNTTTGFRVVRER